jgi:hypothetical protein
MNITGNQEGTDCVSAYGYLNDCITLDIVSVEWSWALVENCNSPCSLGTVTQLPFNSPPVDLSNLTVENQPTYPWLQFFAKINYSDGSYCEDWHQELLYCDNMNLGWNGPKLGADITLSPNPANEFGTINFQGVEFRNIDHIMVLDLSGNTKLEMKPNSQNFNIDNLTPGIYVVQFTTINQKLIQKKLVIK